MPHKSAGKRPPKRATRAAATSAKRAAKRTARKPALRSPRPAEAVGPLAPGGAIEEVAAGVEAPPIGEVPTLSQIIVRGGIAAWSLVGAFLIVGAIVIVLREVDTIFPPVIFSLVIVVLLEPVVAWLVGSGMRRGLAVALVYLALIALIAGASIVAIPAMVRQAQEFADDLPRLLEEGGSLASNVFRRLNQEDLSRRITDAVASFATENASSIPDQLARFASIGLRLANFFVTIVIGLMLGIYGLLALPKMGATFTRIVPAERRAQIAPISARLREVFTEFLRARLIVSAAVGTLTTFGLWAVGMPFWLILGTIVGIANLVPMIGSWIGGIPVLLVAVVTQSTGAIVLVIVVLVVAHAVDGYVLSPRIMQERTRLHPIVVLLAVIVGGALLGVWGIFAAVPVAGGVQVIAQEFLRRRRLETEAV